MESLFATPSLDHITSEDYLKIYEPDQDSFLFLDSLEKEFETIQHIDPYMIVEIGPGSGIISTFLTRIVNAQHPTCTLAIDINEDACRVTKETYKENHIAYGEAIHGNLLQGTLERLRNKVDVLLFNPPYVPTESNEVFQP
ncbi:hypothetical protein WA577_007859 [Blastocystis sp. JDR]